MREHGVRCLLMGGQACVLYGGAEFSRDTDLAILSDPENLDRLRLALTDLQAERIAVPPFEKAFLDRGLAIHFRCGHSDASGQRVDLLAKMRGVDPFPALWDRRTTLDIDGEPIEVLALPDLVQAKKTQRDKDWPMIARLMEASYFRDRDNPSPAQPGFWLREMRTPDVLIDLAGQFPELTVQLTADRSLLRQARAGQADALRDALKTEEEAERAADRAYWLPLRQELEHLRADARKGR
jgi:hypothetical protein